MKVLLTDGNFKHTLAAVRSLGKRGMEVGVVSHMQSCISFRSKYCKHKHIAPESRESGFSERLLEIVKNEHYDVLIPVSYAAVMVASKMRNELRKHVAMALPDDAALMIAGNKGFTMMYAQNIGLTIPKTFSPTSFTEFMNIRYSDVDYPYVIKSPYDSGNIRYANNNTEFINAFIKINPCIVQEYIKGEGYGFFALYDHGKMCVAFMHHRLREYPPTGGPSTMAESIWDPALFEEGKKILDGLEWHGAAMVEFKKDGKGNFVLMEINPKLWGSLELGMASGVDFPYILCEIATGDFAKHTPEYKDFIKESSWYKKGVKFRWPFPQDALRAIATKSKWQFVKDFFDPTIQTDIDVHDIMPNVFQVLMTVAEFLLRRK